jgi:predicted nucleotidyltransferase component of viral defense system
VIPTAFVNAWRSQAPWSTPDQVEQDLVLSRAIVALYRDPTIAQSLAFRGGTVLHKLHLPQASRYSNDLDFVQLAPGPIGPLLNAARKALSPFLAEDDSYNVGEKMTTLTYRFQSEGLPPVPLKLKIEINTREHFSVHPTIRMPFGMANPWFTGTADCVTYSLPELIGTKLRALYQRKKGRDLFDISLVLAKTNVDVGDIVECFHRYMDHERHSVTQRTFIDNLAEKRSSRVFREDMLPLLAPNVRYNIDEAFELVSDRIVPLLRS